jgi:hypothetical protein
MNALLAIAGLNLRNAAVLPSARGFARAWALPIDTAASMIRAEEAHRR